MGALLYEMLSGTPVYDDDEPRLALARARAGDTHSLIVAQPMAPLVLVELIDRALSARPSDRFPDAQSMRREVELVADRTSGFASDAELASIARALVAQRVELVAGGPLGIQFPLPIPVPPRNEVETAPSCVGRSRTDVNHRLVIVVSAATARTDRAVG